MEMTDVDHQVIRVTGDVVTAMISNSGPMPMTLEQVKNAIHEIRDALVTPTAVAAEPIEELKPAVPIRKSVFPDYIVCLEDGLKFKSLKRHISTKYNLSPEEYREKWGLPVDYPMVAPQYSAIRSKLAKDNGLGKKVA